MAFEGLQSPSSEGFSASEAHMPDTQLWRFLHKGRETSRRARRGELLDIVQCQKCFTSERILLQMCATLR